MCLKLVTLFRQQSGRDLYSVCVLYEERCYGNAAFLTQQALEKAFKHVMMKLGLVKQRPKKLKKLTHRPEIGLIKILEKYDDDLKPKNKAEERIKTTVQKLLPFLKELFKASDTSLVPNNTWWKISLGIELDPEKEKEIRRDIRRKLDLLITELQRAKNEAKKINNEENKLVSKMLDEAHKRLKTCRDELKNSSEKPFNAEHSEMRAAIKDAVDCLFSLIPKNNDGRYKKIIGIFKISGWVMTYSLTLLQIASHEQIGRYPEKIGNKDSPVLYKKHADQLYILIEDVKKAIRKLYAI